MMPKYVVFMTGLASACLPLLSQAADPPPDASSAVQTREQIEQALHPQQMHTRGFGTRSFTRTDADPPEPPQQPMSINLNIPFDHNSSAITRKAESQLKQLQLALTGASLGKDRFEVAGHTDAKGNPDYNKQLSYKRAEAVKQFLIANGVGADRLQTVGFGSEHLLAPDRPDDPRNRRVEIRDLGSAAH
jgi:outer membrane protein OmpA-like peptidoglycan-associated protein